MIHEVLFDAGPIRPGEQRSLQAWGDSRMFVEIKCFTNSPPPPGYKACAACGTIPLESGEKTTVTADRRTFELATGRSELHVNLEDLTGDRREYKLRVLTHEEGQSFAAAAGA
jgi:hypothetical protein